MDTKRPMDTQTAIPMESPTDTKMVTQMAQLQMASLQSHNM